MAETAFGSYVLGLAGLGLLRRWYHDDADTARQRLLDITAGYEANEVLNFSFATPELEMRDGYTQWSATYDNGENPMILAEEAVVLPRLQELFAPGAVALDAGCGTGRHAESLADIGYQVIGTDLTPAMLELARVKVPSADFREGLFEALPVEDESVDLITSALAVCHAEDLDAVFAEFARVLRPGGRVLISDPHPSGGNLGGQAFFQGEGNDRPFVRNRAHPLSSYVAAMIGSGFRIENLIELPYSDQVVQALPSHPFFPEITEAGLEGLPFIVIWEASLD